MLKCSHCDKVYKYESERKRHQKSHCPQFDCKVCLKKFSFLSALRRHQKQHERTGKAQCSECERDFRDVTLLKRHIQYSHNGTYRCSECAAVFSSAPALRTHARAHLPAAARRFRCAHAGCSKTFNFAHHLRHHELTHSNAKQHYCNVCGKGFIQAHHLKAHLNTHSNENWLSCTTLDCDKRFNSKSAWIKHIGTHTKISDVKLTDTILCDVCGGLISQQQYINHERQCVSFQEHRRRDETLQEFLHDKKYIKPLNSASGHVLSQPDISAADIGLKGHENSKSNYSDYSSIRFDDKSHTATSDTNNNNDERNCCSGCSCVHKQALCISANSPNTYSLAKPQNIYESKCLPEIEYSVDGIVKIRETFDADIINKEGHGVTVAIKKESNKLKYVPFNSCKAVLGNCIASADGNIDEGCLCAKMIVDEQLMSAQEIDELTPNPNLELIS